MPPACNLLLSLSLPLPATPRFLLGPPHDDRRIHFFVFPAASPLRKKCWQIFFAFANFGLTPENTGAHVTFWGTCPSNYFPDSETGSSFLCRSPETVTPIEHFSLCGIGIPLPRDLPPPPAPVINGISTPPSPEFLPGLPSRLCFFFYDEVASPF